MKQGLFTCSLSTFLQAKASDTDYKRDTYIDTDKYTNFIKHLYTNVRESYVNVAINKFSSQKANTGLQIGRRGDKKVSLLKFYNKSEELINHSTEFNTKYVWLHNSPRTIMRVELTVNGQKEAQRKGLITNKESYTLSKIMQLCAEKTTINTIFANEINSRIVTTNNNNNNCEAMKSKAVEAVKDKKFPKAQSNTIYEVCYYGTLNNSFTLADCQSYASMILNCSEAYRERFLSIAYAVAKRAYEDASVQSGRAKVVIHDDTVMGLFGLQN